MYLSRVLFVLTPTNGKLTLGMLALRGHTNTMFWGDQPKQYFGVRTGHRSVCCRGQEVKFRITVSTAGLFLLNVQV